MVETLRNDIIYYSVLFCYDNLYFYKVPLKYRNCITYIKIIGTFPGGSYCCYPKGKNTDTYIFNLLAWEKTEWRGKKKTAISLSKEYCTLCTLLRRKCSLSGSRVTIHC